MGKTLKKFFGFKTSNKLEKVFIKELFTINIKSSKTKLLNRTLYLKTKETTNINIIPNTNSLSLTLSN